MEMTRELDVLIVRYARDGKVIPSDLGPNRENYQTHMPMFEQTKRLQGRILKCQKMCASGHSVNK